MANKRTPVSDGPPSWAAEPNACKSGYYDPVAGRAEHRDFLLF